MAVNETPRDHASHDELLVVAFASGDLAGRDAERAAALAAGCAECGRIAGDVRALRANVAALPAPRRTRDFRLTEADAARLRPRGWHGLVALLAGPRLSFAAPIGTAIATIGIAGLLVVTAPSLFRAGTASAPALSASGATSAQGVENAAGGQGAGAADTGAAAVASPAAASAAASAGPVQPFAAASAAPDLTVTSPPLAAAPNPAAASGPVASGPVAIAPAASVPAASQPAQAKSAAEPAPSGVTTPSAGARTSPETASQTATAGGAGPLAIVSGILVLVGLVLVIGRLVARRLAT